MGFKMPGIRKNKKHPLADHVECPDDPDLLLLRDAAADERNAILLYLEAANTSVCCPNLFLDVASDEMGHYVQIMRQIAMLDPIQSNKFNEANLEFLSIGRDIRPKWMYEPEYDDDTPTSAPNKQDIQSINYLTRALTDELHAINKYQKYMNQAQHPEVKELFCKLMNDEKEHVAEFTAALFERTGEPVLKK